MQHYVLFVVGSLWAGSALALQRPESLPAQCARSPLVIIGEITGQESFFQEDRSGWVLSRHDLSVLKVLRGTPVESVTVVTPGGRVGSLELHVEHTPELIVDQRYVLLLEPRADGVSWRVVGGEAGAIPVEGDPSDELALLGGCHAS